ncbi:MAG TPA: hypothetical protein PLK80_04165 [bacterium]|nr:hypothetical protein [bacterium]
MKVIFILIGLLFDLVILAISAFMIYSAVDPGVFAMGTETVWPFLEYQRERMIVGGVAAVFFVLSFRGLFLLAFGGSEKVFTLRRSENGALTVSAVTLERLVDRLAGNMQPPAKIISVSFAQSGSALAIRLKIKLDMAACNLGVYTSGLESSVRAYFKDSLGIDISRFDVQAETEKTRNSEQ